MAPPSYSDIGKQSRDVFGKGFHFGVVKLDVKTKSSAGVEINCGGSSTTDGGKVTGNLETKYKDTKNGLTLTEKWSTDNALNTTVDIEGLTKGLKLTVDSSFQPSTGAKSGKVKADFKHDKAVINADLNLAANPVINASATVGHGAISAGYQMAFDTGKSSLTKSNFAVGYNAGDLIVHGTMNDGKNFGAGIYQKISPKLETGVAITAASGSSTFAVGAKYNLDDKASIRAKVANNCNVGLSYQQKLRDGVTLTLSTNVDGNKLNAPGHKLGLALELEA